MTDLVNTGLEYKTAVIHQGLNRMVVTASGGNNIFKARRDSWNGYEKEQPCHIVNLNTLGLAVQGVSALRGWIG